MAAKKAGRPVDRDREDDETAIGVEGQSGDLSVTEDSDLTGNVMYQEDATGGGMHVGEERLDEISIEGDGGTDSPEEYVEIDKGEDLWGES